MPGKALYWDFFGPDAEGTAVHFRKHLEEFLVAEAVDGCELALESAGPGHSAICCRTPEPALALLTQRLRPRRARPLE